MARASGYTLIEILVAIAILAALLVLLLSTAPFLKSRVAAGRALAASCLREVAVWETDYALQAGRYLDLGELLSAPGSPPCLRQACSSESTCEFAVPWEASSEAGPDRLRITLTHGTSRVELLLDGASGESRLRISAR